jgi:hypothetical protein
MAATMALRSAGAMVTCFELSSEVGGLWTHNSGHDTMSYRGCYAPIYPSMRCVVPKDAMAFSDQRFPFLSAQFPHHSVVGEYLKDYGMRRGVHCLTRFNTWVESVTWAGDSAPSGADGSQRRNVWLVRTVNVVNGDVTEWAFDSVVVATGRHHRPRLPDAYAADAPPKPDAGGVIPRNMAPLPNQMAFMQSGGKVLHSGDVKRFRDYGGKTVVVVGNGVGAHEQVKELQRAGALVVHSTDAEVAAAPGAAESMVEGEGPTGMPVTDLFGRLRNSVWQRVAPSATAANPLNDPRLIANILRRRNARLRLSLATVLDSAAMGGEKDHAGKWQRGVDVRSRQLSKKDPKALYRALEAIRGKYAAVPTVGRIASFGSANGSKVEADGSASDVFLHLTNSDVESAADPGGKTDAAAASDRRNATDESLSVAMSLTPPSSTGRLVQMLRHAERNPDAAQSIALRCKFQLTDSAGAVGVDEPELDGKAAESKQNSQTLLRIKNVDTVVFCTGYYQTFPFLKDVAIRRDVEAASCAKQTLLGRKDEPDQRPDAEAEAPTAPGGDSDRAAVAYRGLYMGTVWQQNPTLAFIGMQAELTPAFLLFEAQAKYIAHVFSRRVPLPATAAQMAEREAELGLSAARIAAVGGMGVNASARYYDGLLKESGLGQTHCSYYDTLVSQRRYWFMGTTALSAVNVCRSYAPLKRKKQHRVISNEI